MLYEVYVQGKFYASMETNDSMSLVWKMTNLLGSDKALIEVPWYDSTQPKNIQIAPEDFDINIKGEAGPT